MGSGSILLFECHAINNPTNSYPQEIATTAILGEVLTSVFSFTCSNELRFADTDGSSEG